MAQHFRRVRHSMPANRLERRWRRSGCMYPDWVLVRAD